MDVSSSIAKGRKAVRIFGVASVIATILVLVVAQRTLTSRVGGGGVWR